MLIDFHTHVFPDPIAAKAIPKLSAASGGFIPYADGTKEGLLRHMRSDGVSLSVVLSIATNAHQQRKVNDFAIQLNEMAEMVAFGSVFPTSPDAFEELEYIKEKGLKGVKLHPEYQGFSVDDERLFPLYKKISSLGLITVFHAGVDYGYAPPYGATPEKMARAIRVFDSPVVAAHWGGLDCYREVLTHLCGENLYFDASFGYCKMPKYFAEQILEKHGAEKILFGTDSPWHTAGMEMRLFDSLGLSETEKNAIFFENAKKLLQI